MARAAAFVYGYRDGPRMHENEEWKDLGAQIISRYSVAKIEPLLTRGLLHRFPR